MGILTKADKEKIKRVIPKASNKIIDATVARLYIAYPDPTEWKYTELLGAIVLVDDLVGHTFFLKLVDILGHRGVIWDQELYVDFEYYQDRKFFHSFEIEDCMVGLLFEDTNDASHFYKRVTSRQKHGSKHTVNNKNAIALKQNNPTLGHSMPGPRGEYMDVNTAQRSRRAKGVLYYDDVPPPEWRSLYSELEAAGITEDMIANNREFIKDYIAQQGGPLVGLEPPIPRKFMKKHEFVPEPSPRTDSSTSLSKTKKAPPPPPPVSKSPGPSVYSSSDDFQTGREASTVPGSEYVSAGETSHSSSPAPSPAPPSEPTETKPRFRLPPATAVAPAVPGSSHANQPYQAPVNNQQFNQPPQHQQQQQQQQQQIHRAPPAMPQAGRPVPPPPPARSNPNPISTPVPPPPPRAGTSQTAPKRTGAPPPPPPPRANRGPAPPPPPHRGAKSNVSTQQLGIPMQNTSSIPPPPSTFNQEGSQPIPPNRDYNANTQSAQHPIPPATNTYQPPPPPRAQTSSSNSAPPPPPLPSTSTPTTARNVPPAPPLPPTSTGNAPPAPPLPPTSTGGAPPPPPPLPPTSTGGVPPPPPLPPSNADAPGSTAPLPSADPSRDALLASIRGAGIGVLKKTDKSQLERPSVLLQEAKGETPTVPSSSGAPGGAPGQPTSLADALASALNQRKGKVAASDDDDDDEDW